MHAHLARDIAKYYVAVFQFDPECCIREVLQNLTLHFNSVFLGHAQLTRRDRPALEVGLLQQTFILV